MSGHSRWATIKRKKGAADAAKGKIFTKIAREIMVACRQGGGDPDSNARLRAALVAARAANMPKDNQERAIKKGMGEQGGVAYEEVIYEGRGPGGAAFVLEVMTDNKNRTVSEIRHIFSKAGGEMGGDGSATWMFERRGVLTLDRAKISEDAIMEKALESGADDVLAEDEAWIVFTQPSSFAGVVAALADLEPNSSEIRWVVKPENNAQLSGDPAVNVAKLWAKLDELDDVQTVYCSASLPDDVMEEHGP